jgi:hypothetical protein
VAARVRGESENRTWNAAYALINDEQIRSTVVAAAAKRFGFTIDQVELRLYVGKFAGGGSEAAVREWCTQQAVGAGPIAVVGATDVVKTVHEVAGSKQYRDNAVLATLKVLDAAG